MKIKKSSLFYCVWRALIFSAGHHTHKDYLSHGQSRILSSKPETLHDQTWSTVTNGNNPRVTRLFINGKEHKLYIKKEQRNVISEPLPVCVQQEVLQPSWVEELPVDYDVYLDRDTDPDALRQIHLYRVIWPEPEWFKGGQGSKVWTSSVSGPSSSSWVLQSEHKVRPQFLGTGFKLNQVEPSSWCLCESVSGLIDDHPLFHLDTGQLLAC